MILSPSFRPTLRGGGAVFAVISSPVTEIARQKLTRKLGNSVADLFCMYFAKTNEHFCSKQMSVVAVLQCGRMTGEDVRMEVRKKCLEKNRFEGILV